MKTIERTAEFTEWLDGLRDRVARQRVVIAITRLANGHGVTKSVGGEVREIKLTFGPGYRVYYMQRAELVIVLLTGGDKGSQQRDIARAQELALQIRGRT
jgi:putative addiction module killer protein